MKIQSLLKDILDEALIRPVVDIEYGTNAPDYNNKEIRFFSTVNGFGTVAKTDTGLMPVIVTMDNGQVLFTLSDNDSVVNSLHSMTLYNPAYVRKTIPYFGVLLSVIGLIVTRFHSRITAIQFTTKDRRLATNIRFLITSPAFKQLLTKYSYSNAQETPSEEYGISWTFSKR